MIGCDERLTFNQLTDDEQVRVKKYQEDSGYGLLEMVRDDRQKIVPTLINGRQVDRAKWQEVVRIGARSCTGTFVGKNCVLTAAHCGRNNSTSTLEIYGTDGTLKIYRYRMIHHPNWQNQSNWDLAVLALDDEVEITPARAGIDYTFASGKDVDLLGYGCTRPGGSGGNDGILRFGESKVQGFTGTDVITSWRPSGGALCFGDSGGPMFADGSNSGGQRTLIAVNSKGNIRDTNYNMRLDLEGVKSWLESIANQMGLEIVGVNSDGDVSPEPQSPQEHCDQDRVWAALAKTNRQHAADYEKIAEHYEAMIGSGSSSPSQPEGGDDDSCTFGL